MKIIFCTPVMVFILITSLSCGPSHDNTINNNNQDSIQHSALKNLLSVNEYIDPKGFFSIFPPEGWSIKEFPEDSRGKVHFIKSENNNLMILVKALPQKSFDDFYNYCQNEGKDKLVGAGAQNLTIESSKNGEYRVVKRRFTIQGSKGYMVDYFIDGVNHNIYYSAPTDEFDSYINLIETSILTYNPIIKAISDVDRKLHNLQSRRRVAQLLFEMGDFEQAKVFVEDGFKIFPNDTALKRIEKMISIKQNKK